MRPEYRIEQGIKRDDLSVLNGVADLPANRAEIIQEPGAVADHPFLHGEIDIKRRLALVGLAWILGW